MIKNMSMLIFLIMTLHCYSQIKTQIKIYNLDNEVLVTAIEKNISELVNVCNVAAVDNIVPDISSVNMTDDTKRTILELWTRTNGFSCSKKIVGLDIIMRDFDGKYELRGIPLNVKLEDGSIQQEEGVIVLETDGTIYDFLFGLDTEKYSTFTEGKNITDIRRRQIILNFIETFRTSYNKKDVQYLENVFSDNALIIVGKVLEQKNDLTMINQLKSKKIELIKKNKTEYIAELKKVFKANKYIKVSFDSISIMQHRKYDFIYSATLIQEWQSSGYNDIGYVFILINFSDEQKPLILVRSWQDKTFTQEEDVIQLKDFRFE